MKTNNELSDYGLYMRSKGSMYQVLDQKNAAIVSIIMGFVSFLFGVGAFILRIFLRKKLGVRSYGLVTIGCSFLWIKWVESIYRSQLINTKNADLLTILDYSLTPVINFLDRLLGYNNDSAQKLFTPLSRMSGINDLLQWLSLAILILGFGHYVSAIIRDFRKEKWHSYHRGESLLFKWLMGRSIINIVISDTTIWMVIEPCFVFLISLSLASTPDGTALAFVLRTSAVCLFFQEYMVYQKRKSAILDFIDQEIESEEIFSEINQHKRPQNALGIAQPMQPSEAIS